MGIFSGISQAEGQNRSEFYNPNQLYVVSITEHNTMESKKPENEGCEFFNIRANVLETTDPNLPPGTSVVELNKLKPAGSAEKNLKINGLTLARIRDHLLTICRAMFLQRRAEGVEGFAALSDEDIDTEVNGLNSDAAIEEFMTSLTDAGLGKGVVLGVSTSNYKTKKGGDFTQITYTHDVDGIRELIEKRKSQD